MRVPRVAIAVLTCCLGSSATAQDTPPPDNPVTLAPGQQLPIQAPFPIYAGKCDDPTVATVQQLEGQLHLVGIAPGKTQCGFWGNAITGQRAVVDVTVSGTPDAGE